MKKHISMRLLFIVFAGVCFSMVMFFALREYEHQKAVGIFNRDASDRIALIKHSLELNALTIESLRSFFVNSEIVSRQEFHSFSVHFFDNSTGIKALEWVPRITRDEKEYFVERTRDEGVEFYDITERSVDGALVAVEEREEYFPVHYVEPYAGNEKVLGFDLASNPVRREALLLAKDRDSLIATARIDLVQETGTGYGFLLALPVFDKANQRSDESRELRGYTLGVFYSKDIVDGAIEFLQPSGIDIALRDLSAEKNEQLLYYHTSRTPPGGTSVANDDVDIRLHLNEEFQFGERTWSLDCYSSETYVSKYRTMLPWILFITLLVLTFFLSLIEYITLNESERVNKLVNIRTKELAESEERFRETTDLLPQSVFELDMNGRFTFSNRHGYESTGYSKEDIVRGANALDLFVPEDRERVSQNIRKVLNGEPFDAHEYTIARKDGSTYPALVYSNAIIRDGVPVGVRGIVLDISERAIAEKKLKEFEERWQFALEGGEEGVWDWNIQTNDVFFSKRWKEMLGFREDEISNVLEEWDKRVHPDDKAAVYEDIKKHVDGETLVYINEHRVLCKDGSYKWILDRGKVMVWTEGGEPLRMVGTHTDISERRKTEQALRNSEEKLNNFINSATEGFIQFDSNLSVININEAMLNLTDAKKEQVLGRNIMELSPGVKETDRYERYLKVIETGEPFEIEDLMTHSVFGALNISIKAFKVGDGLGMITSDITERKRSERKIAQQAEELLRSNTELEQFAYIASHDLQEPLRKIQAFGSRLESILDGNLSPKGEDYLHRMQGAANRMRELIESLLSYSRITTKAQPFLPLDLNEILGEVLQDLEISIEKSGGRVETEVLPTINGDRTQIRQLLQNLIGNGLKYHRDGVPPVISVCGGCDKEESMCEIRVEDNGIGIDEKYYDRILQPFQRLHGRNKYEGTGIGLALCKKIVERHNGKIVITSTVGEGTIFRIIIPATLATEEKGTRS